MDLHDRAKIRRTPLADYQVLYYPDFVPDGIWLRRILLLADGVVRIVPTDVSPEDSADILRIREALPDCLTSVAPDSHDVAIEDGEHLRLARIFELLGGQRRDSGSEVTVEISTDGGLSVADHVFVHDAKLSAFVLDQLRMNDLCETNSAESLRSVSLSFRRMRAM